MSERKALVIGDVHGHYDRLEALLVKCGIISTESGFDRIDYDTRVIQLGDLGHFGGTSGSPTGDKLCYKMVYDGFIDEVLWGNHDRAVAEAAHGFNGFIYPDTETVALMRVLEHQGKLKFAAESHGYLLTHAGLHVWPYKQLFKDSHSVEDIVRQLNAPSESVQGLAIDPIGRARWGNYDYGGILWRDFGEKSAKIPQVFGHSKGKNARSDANGNLCIDVGDKNNGRLIGLKLPEYELVEVNLND